jgi:hypothetical protein
MQLQEEIWQAVGRITINYPLLECDKCALSVMRWLNKRGIEGKILRLRTKRRSENFITSDRYGLDESITENGTHYGVEIIGKVFDNLSPEGLSREDWVKDFSCLGGSIIVDELTSL